MKKKIILLFFMVFSYSVSGVAAEDCDLNIQDRGFVSGKLVKSDSDECEFELERDKKYRLKICNLDKLPAEFESHDLHREKIIGPGKFAIVSVGPLEAGEYEFEEEFSGNECEFVVK